MVEFSDDRWHKNLLRLGPAHAQVLRDLHNGVATQAEESILRELACELVVTRSQAGDGG